MFKRTIALILSLMLVLGACTMALAESREKITSADGTTQFYKEGLPIIDPDDEYTAHVRNFAPRYNIPEESATGTANAALTAYLHHHRVIGDGAQCFFLQGEAMGRPSLVQTTMKLKGGVLDIRVGGPCAIVAASCYFFRTS